MGGALDSPAHHYPRDIGQVATGGGGEAEARLVGALASAYADCLARSRSPHRGRETAYRDRVTDHAPAREPSDARAAASVLLDELAAYDRLLGDFPGNDGAMRLARSYRETRADSPLRDDEPEGPPRVDISHPDLVAFESPKRFTLLAARDREADSAAVVGVLREHPTTLPRS